MKCPKCGGKDMQAGDWMRATRQMVRIVNGPWNAAKALRAFGADEYARMYRCAGCGHRFARCGDCHKKWPITARTEAGDTTECSRCGERVVYVGRYA